MTIWRDFGMSEERRYFVYLHGQCCKENLPANDKQHSATSREHELNLTPRFVTKCNITRLVHFESFEDVRNAIEREKQIKAWTRARRIALIESTNPKGNDLSREWDQPQTFRFVSKIA
jgi:putative endonuclease